MNQQNKSLCFWHDVHWILFNSELWQQRFKKAHTHKTYHIILSERLIQQAYPSWFPAPLFPFSSLSFFFSFKPALLVRGQVYIQSSFVFVKQSHISWAVMITFVVMQAEITVIRSHALSKNQWPKSNNWLAQGWGVMLKGEWNVFVCFCFIKAPSTFFCQRISWL